MKKLIYCTASLLLLALQINAQQIIIVKSPSIHSVSSAPPLNVEAIAKVKSSLHVNRIVDVTVNAQDLSDDPMKAKVISKTMNINKGDKVSLDNIYGSITIKTWDRNEVKVDGDIKAYANSDAEAQKLLDNASLSATKENDLLTFKTTIAERDGSWGRGSRNGLKWRREVKVHLTVYMPSNVSLTASQSYGDIVMDDYSGPTSLTVKYGNLSAGNLKNTNNYISVRYGKANLQSLNQGKIFHQFGSGITIGTVGTLELDAEYIAVNINTITNVGIIKHKYGRGITIGSANHLTVTSQFANINLANLKGNATIKSNYGKLTIEEIGQGNKINVDANFCPVSLGFASNYNGDFGVSTNFSNFKYGDRITAKVLGGEDARGGGRNIKSYAGQIGKGGAASVTVTSKHGSVSFK